MANFNVNIKRDLIGGSSAPKQEPSKRLPGGKTKKKEPIGPEVDDGRMKKVAGKLGGENESVCEIKCNENEFFGTAPKQEPSKRLPGGKTKKKDKQEVIIDKVTRNKRKSITTLKGLDLLGPTKKDQIDVQGDIAYDIVEFITDIYLARHPTTTP
ncbi:translation initiation factor SUI1 family protein [Artemisia annua]|uniref:Translation initiation factor SUI1 family protein n=1 Tax=Artemisia annua TaxID=35608 RepID=A0A2U1KZH6_ARTAN|nr:translation initiation factor SUI1 family protein [Artemisia annua]